MKVDVNNSNDESRNSADVVANDDDTLSVEETRRRCFKFMSSNRETLNKALSEFKSREEKKETLDLCTRRMEIETEFGMIRSNREFFKWKRKFLKFHDEVVALEDAVVHDFFCENLDMRECTNFFL